MQAQRKTTFHLPDMISASARLAQVLAEEVDCLDEMRISDLPKYQDEKRKLTRILSDMKTALAENPEIKEQFAEEDKETFRQVASVIEHVLGENYRKLMVAKEVNLRVVQAISDTVKEHSTRPGYGRSGAAKTHTDILPSVTLNETI